MHLPSQFNLNTLTCTLIGLTFALSHVARAYPMLPLEGSLAPPPEDLGSRAIALDPRDDLTGGSYLSSVSDIHERSFDLMSDHLGSMQPEHLSKRGRSENMYAAPGAKPPNSRQAQQSQTQAGTTNTAAQRPQAQVGNNMGYQPAGVTAQPAGVVARPNANRGRVDRYGRPI